MKVYSIVEKWKLGEYYECIIAGIQEDNTNFAAIYNFDGQPTHLEGIGRAYAKKLLAHLQAAGKINNTGRAIVSGDECGVSVQVGIMDLVVVG